MPLQAKSLRVAALAAIHSFFSLSSLSVSVSASPSTITAAPPIPTLGLEARQNQVAGGPGTPILSTLHFPFTALPEQVYPFQVLRGPQFGFNICNSTTEGPTSNCQTLVFNGPDDFCLWGSPDPEGSIGSVEAKVVAYCTKPGHGGRVIPAGAITGLQWMRTPAYIQVSGFIDNRAIGLATNDTGGELDPHGADLQGNPLGGVVYSNSTPDASGGQLSQVFNWNGFVGGGQFCFKACFNSITSPDYCENRYDLVGCQFNMPATISNGTFESCEGDVQDVVGTYTSNGQTLTWSMPDPLNTPPPYTPRIPASSSCTSFNSAQLFAGAPTVSGIGAANATSAPGSSGGSGGSGGSGSSNGGNGTGGQPGSAVGVSSGPASMIVGFVVMVLGGLM